MKTNEQGLIQAFISMSWVRGFWSFVVCSLRTESGTTTIQKPFRRIFHRTKFPAPFVKGLHSCPHVILNFIQINFEVYYVRHWLFPSQILLHKSLKNSLASYGGMCYNWYPLRKKMVQNGANK